MTANVHDMKPGWVMFVCLCQCPTSHFKQLDDKHRIGLNELEQNMLKMLLNSSDILSFSRAKYLRPDQIYIFKIHLIYFIISFFLVILLAMKLSNNLPFSIFNMRDLSESVVKYLTDILIVCPFLFDLYALNNTPFLSFYVFENSLIYLLFILIISFNRFCCLYLC